MSGVFVVLVVFLALGLRGTAMCDDNQPSFLDRVSHYVLDNALRLSFVQQVLDHANDKAMDALQAQLTKLEIPEHSGKSNHVHYSLSGLRITGFTKPSSGIKVDTNTGLTWSAANAGISLHADWRVKWHKMKTSGSVDVSVGRVSFAITVTAVKDSSGQLTVKPGGCTCTVEVVNMRFTGKLKKALNLLRHTVEKSVRDALPGKLCTAVNQQVNLRATSVLNKVNAKVKEASGWVTTVVVVLCVAVIVGILGLWCVTRFLSLWVLTLVGGAVMSVVVFVVISKGQEAVPVILDYLLTFVS